MSFELILSADNKLNVPGTIKMNSILQNAIQVLEDHEVQLERLEEQINPAPLRRPTLPRGKDWFQVLKPIFVSVWSYFARWILVRHKHKL